MPVIDAQETKCNEKGGVVSEVPIRKEEMGEVKESGSKPVWVDRAGALEICPVSYTTLWRISSREGNGIRTTRVGRRIFFDRRSLERYMEERASGGTER